MCPCPLSTDRRRTRSAGSTRPQAFRYVRVQFLVARRRAGPDLAAVHEERIGKPAGRDGPACRRVEVARPRAVSRTSSADCRSASKTGVSIAGSRRSASSTSSQCSSYPTNHSGASSRPYPSLPKAGDWLAADDPTASVPRPRCAGSLMRLSSPGLAVFPVVRPLDPPKALPSSDRRMLVETPCTRRWRRPKRT